MENKGQNEILHMSSFKFTMDGQIANTDDHISNREIIDDLFAGFTLLFNDLVNAVPHKINLDYRYNKSKVGCKKAVWCSYSIGRIFAILNEQSFVIGGRNENQNYCLLAHDGTTGWIDSLTGYTRNCLELIVGNEDIQSALDDINHNMKTYYKFIYDRIVREKLFIERHLQPSTDSSYLFVSQNAESFKDAALLMRFIFIWFGCFESSATCDNTIIGGGVKVSDEFLFFEIKKDKLQEMVEKFGFTNTSIFVKNVESEKEIRTNVIFARI